MSVQAVMRPSHLPLPKTTTSTHSSTHSLAPSSGSFHEQSNRKCMVPVAVDRNRRAGSTPTRSMPTNSLIRAGSVRNSKSATSSEKNLASVAKRTRISNSATSQGNGLSKSSGFENKISDRSFQDIFFYKFLLTSFFNLHFDRKTKDSCYKVFELS